MGVISFSANSCCTAIAVWPVVVQEPAIAPFSWLFSSHCADPHVTPTTFATLLVVICQSGCTSSFTFEFASALTEVEGLPP
jgi:hypothetical protein